MSQLPLFSGRPSADPLRAPVREYEEPAEAAALAAGATWKLNAIDAAKQFLALIDDAEFIAEDIVAWAGRECALPDPPDGRAWGAVMISLKRSGLVQSTGRFVLGKSASPKTVWRRVG